MNKMTDISKIATLDAADPIHGAAPAAGDASADQADFNASDWETKLDKMADEAMKGCGLSDFLYTSIFSGKVDAMLATLAPGLQEQLLQHVRENYYYTSAQELVAERESLVADGCCEHGITRDCCPAGCGDINCGDDGLHEDQPTRPWDYPDTVYPDFSDAELADLQAAPADAERTVVIGLGPGPAPLPATLVHEIHVPGRRSMTQRVLHGLKVALALGRKR